MLMEPERCILFFRLTKEHLIYQQMASNVNALETIVKGTTVI